MTYELAEFLIFSTASSFGLGITLGLLISVTMIFLRRRRGGAYS